MSAFERASSFECLDLVDEFKCQSCGQVPICLNSIRNGHEVCDNCLSLFKADTDTAICPLPACKIPSHMAKKITVIKEDLEKSKRSHENAIKEVKGQILTIKESVEKCSLEQSRFKTSFESVKTEVKKDMLDMKSQVLEEVKKDRQTMDDLKLKVDSLMAKIDSLETESKGLEKRMNEEAKDYEKLKLESFKVFSENLDLKENLNQVKKNLEEFQSSVNLNTKQMMEKMFMIDNSPPQSQLIPLNEFNLINQYHQFQPVFTWKIKGIKEKMGRKSYEETSDTFLWTGYPIKAKMALELKEEDKSVHLSMCLKDTDAAHEKDVKLLPTVYYLLKNQNGNKENGRQRHRIRAACYNFPAKFNVHKTFNKLLAHANWFTDAAYVVDDAVTIEAYVESPEMTRQVHSRIGVLNWVLKDCEKRQSLEKENFISFEDSPYFYTALDGYKVQVQLSLKKAYAFIGFLQGENDSDLPRAFPHRTTITLLNPKDPKCSVVKSIEKDIDEKSWYMMDICEVNQLKDLIKDDTLYVRVNIVKLVQ